jgi:hypothetical protein
MHILAIILLLLVLWWIAFTLLIVRDYKRRAQLPPPPPIPPEELQEMRRHIPQWPSWRDAFTRRALIAVVKRPALLFIVPWVYFVHGVLFLLIWPCFPLHRVYFPHLHTKHEDA